MKRMKRAIVLLLAFILSVTVIPSVQGNIVEAKTESGVVVTVQNASSAPGKEVNVDLTIANNPGILGAAIKVTYDSHLTLTDAVSGDVFSHLVMTKPGKFQSGCKFMWDGLDVPSSGIADGKILTLKFKVADNAEVGATYPVEVTCDAGDFVDGDTNTVDVSFENGVVEMTSFTYGDLNDDTNINSLDVILMRRFIAGGYDVTINEPAADVNLDSKINSLDVILLRRFIAGGYDVQIPPEGSGGELTHKHSMKETAKVEATCTEDGSIAYWFCSGCNKYFSDPAGQNEITLADTVVPAKGHVVVIDPAVAPTTSEPGKTEGSHCAVCGKVIQEQIEIPPLDDPDQYLITYHLYDGDTYLQQQSISNPNPGYYNSKEGLTLKNISCDGYKFDGWFDGEGDKATKVTSIAVGTTGDIDLYAHWSEREYTLQFDSPINTIPSTTYKTSEGKVLPDAEWFGYTFLAWTDDDGQIVKSIPKGTKGNITLHANWTSMRNQTRPEATIKDPIFLEDEDAGVYLFTYKIGRVENVPITEVRNFGNKTGLEITETITSTVSMQKDVAQSTAEAIAQTTTKSTAWSLSKDWNQSTTIDESHLSEVGMTKNEAEDWGTNTNGEFSLSHGNHENNTVTKETGVSGKAGLKLSSESTIGMNAGIKEVPLKVGKGELGLNASRTFGAELSGELESYRKDTKSTESGWNNNIGFSAGYSTSHNKSISTSLSNRVCDQYGISKTYAVGGSESQSTEVAVADSQSREYTTSIAYSDATSVTTNKTYSNATAPSGYYRLVEAGTAHVFGVVGYDIASSQFFTYTFSIMDDDIHDFVDYSAETANFDDNENGVLPFTVPTEAKDYVAEHLSYSEGLVVDPDTGIIEEFDGTCKDVVIPDYYPVDNGDGTVEAVKITGFSSSAFRGNTNIKTVKLGKYITKIPDNAFKGCTTLAAIEGDSITSIGANAFSGCTAINEFKVPTAVKSLGNNAFNGVNKITVGAINTSVAEAAIASGAKNITLTNEADNALLTDRVIEIPEGTERFELQGKEKTFTGLKIDSKADATVLNGVNLEVTSGVPLKATSGSLTLSRVNITAPDLAIVLKADNTDIKLMRNVNVTSNSDNTMLSKSISLSKANTDVTGKLILSGNLLVCGSVTGENLLTAKNVITIDEETYEQMLQGSLEWVLESEMPAGATVVNSKWTYDEKTTITSSNSYEAGYTLESSSYTWSAYGSWSGWSTTKVTSSDSRQVETRNIAATTKTQYNYSRWASNSNNSGQLGPVKGTWSGIYCGYYFERGWSDSALPYHSTQYSNQVGGNFNLYGSNGEWFNQTTRTVTVTPARTEYRYRDRTKIYTYTHSKTESKESATEVTPSSTITNVQKWVQYVH